MALTNASFQDNPQPRDSVADRDAAANSFEGTRMDRMGNVSQVAQQHTTGSSGESAIGAAFLQDNGDAAHNWTATPDKQAAAKVAGTPGFPGDTFNYAAPGKQVLP
jgi:hypothetical protein